MTVTAAKSTGEAGIKTLDDFTVNRSTDTMAGNTIISNGDGTFQWTVGETLVPTNPASSTGTHQCIVAGYHTGYSSDISLKSFSSNATGITYGRTNGTQGNMNMGVTSQGTDLIAAGGARTSYQITIWQKVFTSSSHQASYGELTQNMGHMGATSSPDDMMFAGSSISSRDTISAKAYSSSSNATAFGTLLQGRYGHLFESDDNDAVVIGGSNNSGSPLYKTLKEKWAFNDYSTITGWGHITEDRSECYCGSDGATIGYVAGFYHGGDATYFRLSAGAKSAYASSSDIFTWGSLSATRAQGGGSSDSTNILCSAGKLEGFINATTSELWSLTNNSAATSWGGMTANSGYQGAGAASGNG